MYYLIAVGVNETPGAPQLSFAEKDAGDVYKAFVGGQGPVEVENAVLLLGNDASKESVWLALVAAQVKQPTHFLFYFSGHGNEQGLAVRNGLFPFEWLHRALRRLGASWSMIILDACRAGSFAAFVKEGRIALGATQDMSWYEALAHATPGTRLVFSTGARRSAGENQHLQNGSFTHALLQGMRYARPDIQVGSAAYVSDQRAFSYARWHMRQIQGVRQVPEEMGLTGDFPMLRPESANEVGDGWFSRVFIHPHELRVEMALEGRQFVATRLRYAILNSSWRQLHSGESSFEPLHDGVVVTINLPFEFGWLQTDPLSVAFVSLSGRASFYWALWLEDGEGNELDAKIVPAYALG